MSKQKKRLDSVFATIDFVHKHGVDHEGLCGVMDTQDHFLTMDPAAEVQWPEYLRLHRNLHTIRKCSSPEDFWNNLADLSRSLPQGQASTKHMSLIAEKFISISKEDDMLSVLRAFVTKTFISSFTRASRSSFMMFAECCGSRSARLTP